MEIRPIINTLFRLDVSYCYQSSRNKIRRLLRILRDGYMAELSGKLCRMLWPSMETHEEPTIRSGRYVEERALEVPFAIKVIRNAMTGNRLYKVLDIGNVSSPRKKWYDGIGTGILAEEYAGAKETI